MTAAPTATIEQAGETRSSAIESLRALAALAVLEGHVFGSSRGYGVGAHATFFERLRLGGGFGVFLFFALTGYLLFRPFARRQLGVGRDIRLRRYVANRALRILPLYYVVLAVYLVWIDHGGTFTTWWRGALMLENFFPATLAHVDGVMWSLVVEVQFYILLPFLAAALAVVAGDSPMRLAAWLVALGVATELVRLAFVTTVTHVDVRWEYSLPTTFVFFVPGMILAVVETQWDRRRRLRSATASNSSWWFAASVPLWLVVMWRYDLDVVVLPATFLVLGSVVLDRRRGPVVRALEWRPLAALGVASYSLYLWHFPIVNQLAKASWAPHGYLGLLALCLAVSVVAALVSYRLVESPFLRLRQAWAHPPAPGTSDTEPPAQSGAGGLGLTGLGGV
ncbi:MAG TPA: acyltransferase [Acidimicrobiales bacterium]|nr:acyltransferase [Acidimicrobiales bacterium]